MTNKLTASTLCVGVLAIAAAGCLAEMGEGDEDVTVQSSALVGFTRLIQETTVNTTLVKDLTVYCPPGTVAFGAGFAALTSSNGVLGAQLRYSAPSTDGMSWRVRAAGIVRVGTSWKLQVTLSCGPKVAGYAVVTTETAVGSLSKLSVAPTCSAQKSPKVVTLGGGFGALDASNKVLEGDLVNFSTNGGWWDISAKNMTPDIPWKLKGFTICANTAALPGYAVYTREFPYTAETTTKQTVKAYCDLGQIAVAQGLRLLDTGDHTLEVHDLYSVPVPMGWTSAGLRVPPTKKGLAPRALVTSTVCFN